MSNLQSRAAETAKPVETFYLQADPLTGEPFDVPEPAQFRKCIPVYDAATGELREFLP
jgi:hypothetical protein